MVNVKRRQGDSDLLQRAARFEGPRRIGATGRIRRGELDAALRERISILTFPVPNFKAATIIAVDVVAVEDNSATVVEDVFFECARI